MASFFFPFGVLGDGTEGVCASTLSCSAGSCFACSMSMSAFKTAKPKQMTPTIMAASIHSAGLMGRLSPKSCRLFLVTK